MCKRMKNDGSGFLVLTVYPFLNKIGMNKMRQRDSGMGLRFSAVSHTVLL